MLTKSRPPPSSRNRNFGTNAKVNTMSNVEVLETKQLIRGMELRNSRRQTKIVRLAGLQYFDRQLA